MDPKTGRYPDPKNPPQYNLTFNGQPLGQVVELIVRQPPERPVKYRPLPRAASGNQSP